MAKRRKRVSRNIPAKGRLRDMADRLWSHAVRADWLGRCAVCGYVETDAHHLIPRQWEATRYDLQNGVALCANHHKFDPDVAPHQTPHGWTAWLRDHQNMRHSWVVLTLADGTHRSFDGTKNAAYYCDHIRRLKQYVDDDVYVKIVGVKFSQWLEANE